VILYVSALDLGEYGVIDALSEPCRHSSLLFMGHNIQVARLATAKRLGKGINLFARGVRVIWHMSSAWGNHQGAQELISAYLSITSV
jgi:hypothetical protein